MKSRAILFIWLLCGLAVFAQGFGQSPAFRGAAQLRSTPGITLPSTWGVYATQWTNTAGFTTPLNPVQINNVVSNSVVVALISFGDGVNTTNRLLLSSAGNTYTKLAGFKDAGSGTAIAFYLATNVVAGLDTIGITTSNTQIGAASAIYALACTGVKGFDVAAGKENNPTSPTNVVMTTSVTNSFLEFVLSQNGPFSSSQSLSPSSASSTNVVTTTITGNFRIAIDSFGSGFAANTYTSTFTFSTFGATLVAWLGLK